MYDIAKSTKFKKAYKKVSSYQKFKKKEFEDVITALQKRETLDRKYDDHKVAKTSFPEIQGMRILHLSTNICMIYQVLEESKTIYLYDIGSHQDTGLTEDY
jgi:addiction module RelE/StbE family toxin